MRPPRGAGPGRRATQRFDLQRYASNMVVLLQKCVAVRLDSGGGRVECSTALALELGDQDRRSRDLQRRG